MNDQISITGKAVSFRQFVSKKKDHRLILLLAALAIIIQFFVFKYFYPYASYIHGDSFSYLRAAYYNYDINTYMVGYSRFLRLFSVFLTSDTALTAFQYLFIQSSSLFLLFTLFYFYQLGKVIQFTLLGFMIPNPLFLYLANLISSDCFFASLSILWFALLLWIINKPSNKVLIWHIFILLIAFTVRYNALIYPFISAGTIWFSRVHWHKKVVSIGAGLLLCGLFVTYTSYNYKKLTGIWQYSPFSGWQFANNAMYAYRYVDSADRKPVDKKYQLLDKMIREFFDSTRNTKKYSFEAVQAGTYYMWSPGLPLFKYREKLFKGDTAAGEFQKWASMGPFYKEYGVYIIKKYPQKFVRYFLWPNANKYYAPPVEFLQTYNSGFDSVSSIAKNWFGYKSNKVKTRTGDAEIRILNFYPILSGIINLIMLFGLVFFIMLKGFQKTNKIRTAVALGALIWLLNAGFTIGASSAALRFQSFPILITTIFTLIIIDWIWVIAREKQSDQGPIRQDNNLPTEAMASG